MSEGVDFSEIFKNKLKSVSVRTLEEAIAKAISEVTEEEFEVYVVRPCGTFW